MIKFKIGNIIAEQAEALINTVNTVGVMGKGIALSFKKAFPENYKIYKKLCENNIFQIGDLLITETNMLSPKYIINFPTKKHWRGHSKIEYIEIGLKKLNNTIKEYNISSIAIPPLGCGSGGLDWEIVKKVILTELEPIKNEVDIIIFEPGYNNQLITEIKKEVKLTPARAMLLSALNSYQILGYSINLLVTQKIAYFLQRLGEPLNLDFEKGWYGPYSNKLQHLLKYLNGYFLRFKYNATKPSTKVYLNHLESVKNYSKMKLDNNQKDILNKINKLIEGFESPYGLELLATVDFIIQHNKSIQNKEEIINDIGNWTKRKKELMKPYHIEVAYKRLNKYYRQQWL